MAERHATCAVDDSLPEQMEKRGNLPATNNRYYYLTYGLKICSTLELPELPEIAPCEHPDVWVTTPGAVDRLEDGTNLSHWLEIGDECCQIHIEGIARYRVEKGQRIMLDRRMPQGADPAADPGDVRLFLLGSALGALLHQRHWLPLHVSALKTPAGAWAFTGHSGAGKSTMSAWLHYAQQWPLITDDVAVIKPDEAEPLLHPGPARVKLWRDALTALGIETEGLVRDLMRNEKFHLMVNKDVRYDAHRLSALVQLERADDGEAASLVKLSGVEAFKTVMGAIYRPELGNEFNTNEQLMHECIRLAQQINVYRFRRPWSLEDMNQNLKPLLDEIQAQAVASELS
ncbi:hypothetical protein [Vreelandella populi]|uniref:Uncharacterized protein n=1 Tax=Vreelandella populi TaxID=2498858 RepID=A0A433LF52_9GAMM|nr:hypothetical protein [Halomonas populi]RUR35561.1 hypothetical protein ELY25_16360 [Halomonas populi]RUR47751.1 hypothetical protein ELY37_05715 [Halomonas populi]RUR54386.1 hypothetical protein ELY40_08715 [Halomonas populi]